MYVNFVYEWFIHMKNKEFQDENISADYITSEIHHTDIKDLF